VLSWRRRRTRAANVDALTLKDVLDRLVDVHVYSNELLPDGTRRSIYVGPHRERLMGGPVPPGKDPATEWRARIHPDDQAAAEAHHDRLQRGEASQVEYRLVGYDGVVRWVAGMTQPRRLPGRAVYDGVVWDVTARRQAEEESARLLEELAAQNERLRELDHLKDEFLALVSHELRTPLTSIRGFIELTLLGEAGEIPPQAVQFLSVADRNAQRLQRLVDDLLFMAQSDAGRLSLERETVRLAELVAECLEASAPAALAAGVSLTSTVEAAPEVLGDRSRLAQLLDNLVSNAIKFTPPGGEVEVSLAVEGERSVLAVRDTGTGIAPDELDRLFDRFYRTTAAVRGAVQGTGLGLAISRTIAQAHGGTISVSSVEGSGATFRVELPLASPAASGLAA
jgi:signal transduction histidine kinase